MYEEGRPLGIKIISLSLFMAGLGGLYISLSCADEIVRNVILDSDLLRAIGGLFDNIHFQRMLITIFSIFYLWLGILVFSMKKIARYFLLPLMGLPLLMYFIFLIIININNITLNNLQRIGIAFRIFVDLIWLLYIIFAIHYFVN